MKNILKSTYKIYANIFLLYHVLLRIAFEVEYKIYIFKYSIAIKRASGRTVEKKDLNANVYYFLANWNKIYKNKMNVDLQQWKDTMTAKKWEVVS